MRHHISILHSEDEIPTMWVSVTVSQLAESKINNRLQRKPSAAIEFPLLEGRTGEEIVIRLRNVYSLAADCRALVFRWIGEGRRGNKEL
jgi:hypothetical protein